MDISVHVNEQREYFMKGATLDYSFRLTALQKLSVAITEMGSEIVAALTADLNKSEIEGFMTEIGTVQGEIKYAIRKLSKWMKATGTGIIQIKETQENKYYREKYTYICGILKGLCPDHVNPYDDLWSLYSNYNTGELKIYQNRRIFIRDMYEPLLATIRNPDKSSFY